MHQKAIVGGSAEPRGKGAAATVRKRMIDEILFDGGGFCAFVTFKPVWSSKSGQQIRA
jgi:hypothetical protein